MENKYLKIGIVAIMLVVVLIVGYGIYINVVSNQHVEKMTQAQYASVTGAKVGYYEIHPSLTHKSITVRAEWMEDIQAQIDGMVTKVFIQAGNHVQAGTVIAEVENVDLPAQIAQAEGVISQAKAKRVGAEQDVERYRILAEQGAASQKQYEDAKMSMAVAQGELDAAIAQRQQLLVKQGKNVIIAPRTGDILNLYCHQGYYIRTGESICLIGDFSKMIFQTSLDDEIAKNLWKIKNFYIPLNKTILKNRAYNVNDSQRKGYESRVPVELVEAIPAFSEPADVRTLTWHIVGQDVSIEPTSYGDVDIIAQNGTQILGVPLSALIYNDIYHPEDAEVFVVDGNNKLAVRKVSLGQRDDTYVETLSGLSEGETVIISGKQGLTTGDQVRIIHNEEKVLNHGK